MLKIFSGLVISLVILLYFLYNIYFSVNFPFQDDFLLIQFIEVVSQGGLGFNGLVKELFRTFNDHKAVVPRLISLIEYSITGHLNFRFYIVLVLINISYIFYFVYLQFRKTKLPLPYFIPVPFLFFQPLFHEVTGWALNGLQHSFLTAFTITAILLASRKTDRAFLGAMVCCMLATFTHGNGILSFPAILFYYLCFKDLRRALGTGVFMILALVIYVAGYESGQAAGLPKNAIALLTSLFGFIGSSMSLWGDAVYWSAIWGILITAYMVFITAKVGGIYFNKPVPIKPGTTELLALFAFIFVTSAVVAVFRSWTGSTLASRFQMYASLSTVILYILLLDYASFFRKKRVLSVITALSIFYWGYSYYKFTATVAAKKTTYLADLYNWEVNRKMFSIEKTIVDNADFYLLPAYEKGFFRLPAPVVQKSQLDSMYGAAEHSKTNGKLRVEDWQVERFSKKGSERLTYYFLTSDTHPGLKPLLAERFLVLKDPESGHIHLMQGNPKTEARKQILTSGMYFKSGFNTMLRSDDMAPGHYQLAVLDIARDGTKRFYLFDQILIAANGNYQLQ